jgi:hypothetical protein
VSIREPRTIPSTGRSNKAAAASRMLVTRKQKGDAKGRGDIRAWLGSLPITKPPRSNLLIQGVTITLIGSLNFSMKEYFSFVLFTDIVS